MFASIATIALGLVIVAALLALNWYIWRARPVLPYPLAALERSPGEHGIPIHPDRQCERSPQPISATSGNEYAVHI
jgi:hypothetical protein